jgi:hypothetical protein
MVSENLKVKQKLQMPLLTILVSKCRLNRNEDTLFFRLCSSELLTDIEFLRMTIKRGVSRFKNEVAA